MKIGKANGPLGDTSSIVDSAVAGVHASSIGNWGRSLGTSSSASAGPQFFDIERVSNGVLFVGPASSRTVPAGLSNNLIPASLMAGHTPPGLANVGRGLNIAAPETTPVPLPAAAWLFISALLGLILIGRQRRQYATAA